MKRLVLSTMIAGLCCAPALVVVATPAAADTLPICTADQQPLDSASGTPTPVGRQATVRIKLTDTSFATIGASVDGGPFKVVDESDLDHAGVVSFKMLNHEVTVVVVGTRTYGTEGEDDPDSPNYLGSIADDPLCTQTLTVHVHRKPGAIPHYAVKVTDANSSIPTIDFTHPGSCDAVADQPVTWTVQYDGRKPHTSTRPACRQYRADFSVLALYPINGGRKTTQGNLTVSTHDLIVKASTKGRKQAWRFRMVEKFYPGRSIEDTNFDDYVNICIEQTRDIYAQGGHLWCDTASGLSERLTQVK